MERVHEEMLVSGYNVTYGTKKTKKEDAFLYLNGLRKIWDASKEVSVENEEFFNSLAHSLVSNDIIKVGKGVKFLIDVANRKVVLK